MVRVCRDYGLFGGVFPAKLNAADEALREQQNTLFLIGPINQLTKLN